MYQLPGLCGSKLGATLVEPVTLKTVTLKTVTLKTVTLKLIVRCKRITAIRWENKEGRPQVEKTSSLVRISTVDPFKEFQSLFSGFVRDSLRD